MGDKAKYGVGIDYGYGIMQFKTVPLLTPKLFNVWGHAGGTGAYMFVLLMTFLMKKTRKRFDFFPFFTPTMSP
ncbi:hypothetical protein [Lederbergia citrea]|nr:hypothetical protein [Lederbergia citrea]MBS4205863.1 hypothetical protein [Lederbergia citrea]